MKHRLNLFCIGVCALMVCLPGVVDAYGPEVWTNLDLYGGNVQVVAVDPSRPDRLYAGIWFGEGLYRSLDGAVSWQALKMAHLAQGEDTFENQALLGLAVSPANPDVIWAAHNYWIARSTDGGDTWAHIYNSTVQRDCLNCGGATDNFRFCFAVAADPNDPEVAYAGTAGAWSTYSGGAIYKTTDGGVSWEKLNQGIDLDYNVVSLAVDPNAPQVVWAVTDSFGIGGVSAGTLYRSSDSGRNWTPVSPQPFISGGLYQVIPHPVNSDTVFVCGADGVARGVFDGNAWQFTLPIAGSSEAHGLVFAPSDANIAYLGGKGPPDATGEQPPILWRSSDSGLTWAAHSLDPVLISQPKTLAVHPGDPGMVYLGDFSGGVLNSRDNGLTWNPVNMGLSGIIIHDIAVDDIDSAHMIAATSGGVYERTGTDWQRRLIHHARSVTFVPGSGDAYFAGLWEHLAATRDGGANWTLSTQAADGWVDDIAVDPLNPQVVFLADESHVRRSLDGGDTFDPVLEGRNLSGEAHDINTLAIDPHNNRHIYAGGGEFYSPRILGDLWESIDSGDTWRRTGLTDVIVNKVLMDPVTPGILYAGCGYSDHRHGPPLFKSEDGGISWLPADTGLPMESPALIGVWPESANSAYAVGGQREVYHITASMVERLVPPKNEQTAGLESVFGLDASHIYVAGGDGTVLHFDGTAWLTMNSGTSVNLEAIWGTAPDNLFTVGVDGVILHYDGNSWTAMVSGTTATLHEISGTSGNDVYTVGQGGTILHYDGNDWSSMSTPATETLFALWAAAPDTVFAGGDDGGLYFYDGRQWSAMHSPVQVDINKIWARSAHEAYATTDNSGEILRFDGTAWSTAPTIPGSDNLSALRGLPDGTLFAVDYYGGMFRFDGLQWETLHPSGSRFRAVTDIALHRDNPDILYASTWQAGVYVSPDQAGQWLHLGTPTTSVNAIASGSLYAATDGGLYQLTGTGVLAGDVYDTNSIAMLDGAWVTTDLGIGNRTIDGRYMLVVPSGEYDLFAAADSYELGVAHNVRVNGADVSWVDFQMATGILQLPADIEARENIVINDSGSGGYCFVRTIAPTSGLSGAVTFWLGLTGVILGLLHQLRRRPIERLKGAVVLFFLMALPSPAWSFTVFEQVGLASAPQPVGSGARALGMGGAFIAVADDATAASWNPAGLIQVEKPEVSIVGAWVDRSEAFSSGTSPEIDNTGDVSYESVNYVSITFPFHWHKNLVASINYQRLFDFRREFQYQRNVTSPDQDLNQQIRFHQDGFIGAIGLAGAVEMTPRLSLGATVNVWTDQAGYDNGWREKYNEVATGTQSGVPANIQTAIEDRYEQFRGINFNLGLLWDKESWGTFGAVIKTPFTATIQHRFRLDQTTVLGNPVNSVTVTGPITIKEEVKLYMPVSYGLGWSRRFKDTFTIGIDIFRTEWGDYTLTNGQGEKFSPIDGRPKGQSNVDATTHLRIGAEYVFLIPKHGIAIPMRGGLFYDPEPSEGSPKDVYGLALGAGLTFKRCSLDIAYQRRWADEVDSGDLIAGSKADVTQHTILASLIYYF